MKRTLLLLALFGFSVAAYSQDLLTNGLVAFYTFEGSGSDVSGNANHSTPAGNYQFVAGGLSGNAIRTVGDNSVFYSGGGHVMLPAFGNEMNSGFSASLWVRDEIPGSGATDVEMYLSLQSSGSASAFTTQIALVNRAPPYVGFFNGNGSGVAVAAQQTINLASYPNSWKHLVVVTSPTNFACYFNGFEIYATNISYTVFPAPLAALGRHWFATGSSARMSATYDNVRIYNRALSTLEVQQLYAYEGRPRVDLIKAVKPSFSFLSMGTNYQLQLSGDLIVWTNHGGSFLATNSTTIYPQYWDVDNWGKLFFRLQSVP